MKLVSTFGDILKDGTEPLSRTVAVPKALNK